MRKVYLSGAMANCTPEEMHGWREQVKELAPNYDYIDPTNRIYGLTHHDSAEIVIQDKKDITSSDILFLYVSNKERMSFGSAMEVLYAWQQHKKIIVVWESELLVSAWIDYHASNIFHSLEEGISFLRGLDDK